MADKEKKKKKKVKEEGAKEEAAPAPAPEPPAPEPAPAPPAPASVKRPSSKSSKKAKRSGSSVFSMFTEFQVAEFKEGFSLMDKDKDGIIGREDLRATWDQCGKLTTDKELDEMLKEAQGPINFTQLLTLFANRMSGGSDPDDVVRDAFKAFDKNGLINSEELKHALKTWGDKFSQKELNDAFDAMDIDDKGMIDTEGLIQMLVGGAENEEGAEGFSLMDVDKDGILGKEDLRATWDQLGKLVTDKELDDMLDEANGNPINFTQMLHLFAARMSGGSDPDDVVKEAFLAFDKDGLIDAEELKHALLNWGDKFTKKEAKDALDAMDIDKNGKIVTEELIQMMIGTDEE